MFDKAQNFIGNYLSKEKKAFNDLCGKYKIRICNNKDLTVYALREGEDLIILPTLVSANDVAVDMHNNKFFIGKILEDKKTIKVDDEEKEIKVLKLITDNSFLKNILISSYVQDISNKITNRIGDISGNGNIISISSDISNKINLDINDYWRKLKNEMDYQFDNRPYKPIVNEIDSAVLNKREVNKEKVTKFLKSIGGFIRDCVIDFLAKYAAEMTKAL